MDEKGRKKKKQAEERARVQEEEARKQRGYKQHARAALKKPK